MRRDEETKIEDEGNRSKADEDGEEGKESLSMSQAEESPEKYMPDSLEKCSPIREDAA